MSSPTHTKRPGDGGAESIPTLENGDRLDQPTFHARYLAMPEGIRAELIGGVVYMHSPAKRPHGRTTARVVAWLIAYEESTPGTEAYDNVSNLLGPESEPQPDACLLIARASGGQTIDKDEWIVGAPELIAEVALSSESIDLHAKKQDYQKAGVKEYLVLALRQQRVYWFVNRDEVLTEVEPGPDGLYRSEVFPGLWLDPAALLRGDMGRVRATLADGLASSEHADFVAHLRARSGGNPP
jgi:Uma2 family endonuclease